MLNDGGIMVQFLT